MKKKIFIILMIFTLFVFFYGCAGSGDNTHFPYRVLPMYKGGTVESESANGNDLSVTYIVEENIDTICDFYTLIFSSEVYSLVNESENERRYNYAGYVDDYFFQLTIESENSKKTQVEMIVSLMKTVQDSKGGLIGVAGEPVILLNEEVDESGCSYDIVDPVSDIKAEITIHPAAVDGTIELRSGFSEVTGNMKNLTVSNRAVVLDIGGNKSLSTPAEITISYSNDAEIPIPCAIDEKNGRLLPTTILEINKVKKTVTFLGMYSTNYTWVYVPAINYTANSGDYGIKILSATTDYQPSTDGFKEVNQGSEYLSGGECFGMTTFSTWYYANKKMENGPLFQSFIGGNFGYRELGNGDVDIINIQDVIATRAHRHLIDEQQAIINEAQLYDSRYTLNTQDLVVDNCVSLMTIILSISIFNMPINTLFYGDAQVYDESIDDFVVSGHSLVAYGYYVEGTKVHIRVYDCNIPGNDEAEIIYDLKTDTFKVDTGDITYDVDMQKKLFCVGAGTFNNEESFEKIYSDALEEFKNTQAHIEITSHQYGDTVNAPYVTIEGVVDNLSILREMGENIIDVVEIIMSDGSVFSQSIDPESGRFQIDVPLMTGANYMNFNLVYLEFVDGHTERRTLDHDMYKDFMLNCSMGNLPVLVTLTWDTQPDVDLYVYDPNGEAAWWNDMITSDGGELDIDDISSYGPEHFTLSSEDTIRWGEEYLVRLHYYNGVAPTRYSVTIALNVGTDNYSVQHYTGVLEVSNCDNAHPLAEGDDWVDIDIFIPIQN